MNLRSEIRPDLWEAISQPYEAENYSNAILAALHYLRDVLRDRANVDGDGVALIGQALGGTPPRLRINRFENESERDEQKGLEQILRGMYQGIRNPRTHEKFEDKKESADAIVVFINYILSIVTKAKGPFVLEDWLNRVFDPDFVGTERYAALLASEVPPKKCIETLIAIYNNKTEGEGDKLKLIFDVLIRLAGDDKLDELIVTVSDELKVVQDEAKIRRALQILPPRLWPRVDEVARLRIENKLIRSIENGGANSSTRRSTSGTLGTWTRDFIPHFTLKNELYRTLLKKLQGAEEERSYVALFFWSTLPHTFETPVNRPTRTLWIGAICQAILEPSGSSIVRQRLADTIHSFPEDWRESIIEKLKPLEEDDPEFYKSITGPSEEGEIPF